MPLHEAVVDAQMRKRALIAAVLQAGVGIPKVGGVGTLLQKIIAGSKAQNSDRPDHNFCPFYYFFIIEQINSNYESSEVEGHIFKKREEHRSNQLPRENSVINSTDNAGTGAKPKETGC